jgi:hypothetical protein
VIGFSGKGVYSTVVRATGADGDEYAIKIMRNRPTMDDVGRKEAEVVRRLNALDPNGQHNVVRICD